MQGLFILEGLQFVPYSKTFCILGKIYLMNLGWTEIIIIAVVIIIPIVFIYKYGKQKGRIKEMERQIQERENKPI